MFAFLFGQSFHPTVAHPVLTLAPRLLFRLFQLTFPASVLLLLTFLFELTALEPDRRSLVYRSELAKVYFSVIYWYVCSMSFANWLQSLRKFINKVSKQQERLKSGTGSKGGGAGSQGYVNVGGKTQISKAKKEQILRFTFTRFSLTEALEVFMNQFD